VARKRINADATMRMGIEIYHLYYITDIGRDKPRPTRSSYASGTGFVWEIEEIINNLAALKWVRLGSFQSYVIDSIQ